MGGLTKLMNPIGAIAGKQGGTVGKLLDPVQAIGARQKGLGKMVDPMNVLRTPDEAAAHKKLLGE